MRIFKSEVKELQAENRSDAPVTPQQPGFAAPAQPVASERLDVPPSSPTDIRPA